MLHKVRVSRIIQKWCRSMNHIIEILLLKGLVPSPSRSIVGDDDEVELSRVFGMEGDDLFAFGRGTDRWKGIVSFLYIP